MGIESLGRAGGAGANERHLASLTTPGVTSNDALDMSNVPTLTTLLSQNKGADQEALHEIVKQVRIDRLNAALGRSPTQDELDDNTNLGARQTEIIFAKIIKGEELSPEEDGTTHEARAAFFARSESARVAQEYINTDNLQRLVEIGGLRGNNPFLAGLVGKVGQARSTEYIRDALRRNALTDPAGFAATANFLRQAQQYREGEAYKRLDGRVSTQVDKINSKLPADQQVDRSAVEKLLGSNEVGGRGFKGLFRTMGHVRRELGIGWVASLWHANDLQLLKNQLVSSRDLAAIDANISSAARFLAPTLEKDVQLRKSLADDLRAAMAGDKPKPIAKTQPESITSRVKGAETASFTKSVDDMVSEFETNLAAAPASLNAADRHRIFQKFRDDQNNAEEPQWGTGLIGAIMRLLFDSRWNEIEGRLAHHFT